MIKYLLYGGQGFKIFIKFCVYNSNNKILDQMNNVVDSTDINDEIIEYVCSLQTKRKEKRKKKKKKKTFVCAGNPKVKKKKRNRKEV